jgi:hypothetical protein
VERTAYVLDGGTYYVADQPADGRTTLNRYMNPGATDHADGTSQPSGYTFEEVLGYPWAQSSLPGLDVLSEAFNPSTGDYALIAPSESLSGYTANSLGVYGYPRFANTSEVLLSLSAGGVTVESNKAAGGVTWRWFWNGMQFENHFGFGGEIQAAFYFVGRPELTMPTLVIRSVSLNLTRFNTRSVVGVGGGAECGGGVTVLGGLPPPQASRLKAANKVAGRK